MICEDSLLEVGPERRLMEVAKNMSTFLKESHKNIYDMHFEKNKDTGGRVGGMEDVGTRSEEKCKMRRDGLQEAMLGRFKKGCIVNC